MLSPLTGSLSPLGMGKARGSAWINFVSSLSPLLWFRFNEASGSLINQGSVASSDAAYIGSGTPPLYQQAGIVGPVDAIDFSPGNEFLVTYQPGWGDVSVFEFWAVLYHQANVGVQNTRYFGLGPGYQWARTASTTFANCTMRNTAGQAFGTQSNNLGVDLTTNYLLGFTYDDVTDRKARLYRNGVECTYSNQTALTGTFKGPTLGGTIGNNLGGAAQFDGLYDELIMLPAIQTALIRAEAVSILGL